jgi:hypothetical protein
MPLLRIDVLEGRSKAELKELLDAILCATLAAFQVPERDRYQIVHKHPVAEMIIEDTGLGIPRTETKRAGSKQFRLSRDGRSQQAMN